MRHVSTGFVMVLLLAGCRTHTLSRAFIPQSAVVDVPVTQTLLVEYPLENRPLGGKSKVWNGMLVLIPLVPYGHNVATPEFYMRGRYRFSYSFNSDLQEAIIKDVKASGLAKEVLAGGRQLKDFRMRYDLATTGTVAPEFTWEGGTNAVPKGARVLSLRLDEGVMNSYVTTYGLSFAVFPFWLVGAPIAYSDFDLKLTALLKDDQGRVLAERSFAAKDDYCECLYNNGAGLRSMPRAYGEISGKLREFLKANLR